ncbi:hypothetical protein PP175_21010 [Aneurinibacillus sp. Ricciae_BoGa-3]|uniref:hypothetical protein n=1 Tax=Aneurinibacillus sp. Ricciae_BoGa-3 TaxID=3022697 RepID=UPI002341FD37|nr:hypothetical protein [Aneurinibacillus sp. Ricciae_BoGa-3]WCK53775.1 hypothetical protein PP175_21010 [Aneurinibacillus sp. Ricciae_BoGa-3]
MAITPLTRLVSSGSATPAPRRTFVALDRPTAISLARANQGEQAFALVAQADSVATDEGRVFQGWPKLTPYRNDNSNFTKIEPAYVWDSYTTAGQMRFFAISSTTFQLLTGQQVLIDLWVFCDNAHDVQIDVFDLTQSDTFTTISPPDNLSDGMLDPNTGTTDDVPFNWLNVQYYSNTSIPVPDTRNGDTFQVVLSFEAVNYNIDPPNAFNPAGLSFAADLYLG